MCHLGEALGKGRRLKTRSSENYTRSDTRLVLVIAFFILRFLKTSTLDSRGSDMDGDGPIPYQHFIEYNTVVTPDAGNFIKYATFGTPDAENLVKYLTFQPPDVEHYQKAILFENPMQKTL